MADCMLQSHLWHYLWCLEDAHRQSCSVQVLTCCDCRWSSRTAAPSTSRACRIHNASFRSGLLMTLAQLSLPASLLVCLHPGGLATHGAWSADAAVA